MLVKCNIRFATHLASILVDGDLERMQCFKYDDNHNQCEWESFGFDEQDQLADYIFQPLEQFHYSVVWNDE